MKTLFTKLLASQIVLAATLFSGVAGAETLTLYTSQPEADAARTVDAFKKAHPGIDVTIYRSGTSDILTKMAAEFAAARVALPSHQSLELARAPDGRFSFRVENRG